VPGRLNAAGWPLFGQLEERWYRTGAGDMGVRQFLVQDPDGYLVRPQESLGSRLSRADQPLADSVPAVARTA
jgi:hypothetical protein